MPSRDPAFSGETKTGSAVIAAYGLRSLIAAYPLTQREMDIVMMVLRGFSNKEIAHHFSIAEQTVKDHLKHVYGKVGVHQRTALCAKLLGVAGLAI